MIRIAPRSKYHAKRTTLDGIAFDSQAEAGRYAELRLLLRAGSIRHLELQPAFPLYATTTPGPADLRIGVYRADFAYEELTETGGRWDRVVEDVKGIDTALSRWKRRHVLAQYGIAVALIRRAAR